MNSYRHAHELNLEQTRLVSVLINSGSDDFEIETQLILDQLVSRTAAQRGNSTKEAREILINYFEAPTMSDKPAQILTALIDELKGKCGRWK